MFDIHNNMAVIANARANAQTTASAITCGGDRTGYQGLEFLVNLGALGAAITIAGVLEDSPDNSTWTAVAADFRLGALPALATADAAKSYKLGYVGKQKYVRLVLTPAGTVANGLTVAVNLIGFTPLKAPKATQLV